MQTHNTHAHGDHFHVHDHAHEAHSHIHSRGGQTHTHEDGSPQAVAWDGVTARYGTILALNDVSFSVDTCSLVGVVGPNGSGKSTLLKSVVGLVKPQQGEVYVQGRPSREMLKDIGFVPQLEQVEWNFPVSVWDVVMMGLTPQRGLFRWHSKPDQDAAAEALSTVNLANLRQRNIGELSGGQRRRALLARAIASEPSVLLLDEPMNGLDPTTQHSFLDILDLLRERGTTVIMSTHDLTCVSARASDVALINRGLVAYGPPDEVLLESVLADVFGHQLVAQAAAGVHALRHQDHEISWPGQSV